MPEYVSEDGSELTPAQQTEASALFAQPAPATEENVPEATMLDPYKPPQYVDDQDKPLSLTPEQKRQYRRSAGIVDPLADMTPEDLVKLARETKDDDLPFNIAAAWAARPDLQHDPEAVHNVADAWHAWRSDVGIGDLPNVFELSKNIWNTAIGLGKYAGSLLWDVPQAYLRKEGTPEQAKHGRRAAELSSASRLALSGLANQAQSIAEKVMEQKDPFTTIVSTAGLMKPAPAFTPTPENKVERFFADMAKIQQAQEIATGHGPIGIPQETLDKLTAAGFPVRPEEVQSLAAGDPLTFAAFGKAFGLAGKVMPGVSEAALRTAGQVTAGVGGRALTEGARFAKTVLPPIAKAAPAVGAVKGAAIGLAHGAAPVESAILGFGAGKVAKKMIEGWLPKAEALGEAGKQIADKLPVSGSYTQLAKDILQSTPAAAYEMGKGALFDVAMGLSAETPDDAKSVGIGSFFGLLGGAGRMGGHVLSGQLVGPRDFGMTRRIPDNGAFPQLEGTHQTTLADANEGTQNRVNYIRSFLHSLDPNGEFVYAGPRPAEGPDPFEASLVSAGVTPARAAEIAAQDGGRVVLNGKNLYFARDVAAAPHEVAGHGLEGVLGEDVMRGFDRTIQADPTYAKNWDNLAQRYAYRLGWQPESGESWQDAILRLSNWDKINTQELGHELTPDERTQIANRYISREIFAENEDAAFKHRGGFEDKDNTLPAKIARMVGGFMSYMGRDPLTGRLSEYGKFPLSYKLSKAASEAGTAALEGREVLPPEAARGAPATMPVTPEQQAQAAEDAKKIAQSAPNVPGAAGGRSQSELLGEVAKAIADRSGVVIQHAGAPGEPAAAITQNRGARRAIIEAFRTMPQSAKTLWQKLFFPERVIPTKSGKYQVMGWAPEVFAANAHRTAQAIADMIIANPKNGSLSPFPIDTVARSFTPQGWQDLYDATSQFVRNQMAGRTGSGVPLVVPRFEADKGLFAPALGVGRGVPQNQADFISMLFGFKLPETPRITGGKLPLSIAGEDISAATIPGRVASPVRPRGTFEGPKAEELDIEGRSIQEVNPLRSQLERASQDTGVPLPSLIEAVQRLNLENIKDVTHAPEQPQFRGNSLALAAGFQPPREAPEGAQFQVTREAEDRGPELLPEAIQGGSVNQPKPFYHEAADQQGQNPWVRRSADPARSAQADNTGRTLLVQMSSDLINPESLSGAAKDEATRYYDMLYSGARPGYARAQDFWEIPQWIGFASHFIPDADVYVVRDLNQAKEFLNTARYDRVAFSALDTNKALIRELAKDYKGNVDVGGYVDPKTFEDMPNVKWHNSMESLAQDMGIPYAEGVDYRHFQGSDVIPRLTMSKGCRHKCAFCTVEKQVVETPAEVVAQQADAIAKLGTKLVYLNDKTFGQASNYKDLEKLNTQIKAQNPDFSGFVVQTTAAQLKTMPADWLARSGIKFVELGVESYNDPILRAMHKPAKESLINEVTDKLRQNHIALIPNIIIGFPEETAETYARTLKFLRDNKDIISHANIYNLALYKDAELGKKIVTGADSDFNENVLEKSFHTNPEVHRQFAGDVYGLATEMLQGKPESAQFQPGVESIDRLPETRDELFPLSMQFQPSKSPRAIRAAAVQDPETGKIYEGAAHLFARSQAMEAGLGWRDLLRLVDGFVTNTPGEFLDRKQSLARAEEEKQLTKYQLQGHSPELLSEDLKPVKLPVLGQFQGTREDENKIGPVYYSQLNRVVNSKFTGASMPADQLAAILRNPQNGVKADEMKWTGLDDFLKGKQRVTKEEVQEFLKQNAVQVKEVTKGGEKSLTAEDRDEMASMANRLVEENWYRQPATDDDLELDAAASAGVEKCMRNLLQAAKDGNPSAMRQAANKLGDIYDSWGLDSTLATEVETKVTRFEEKLDTPSTKFKNYQLPGGENYKEMLFTLPNAKPSFKSGHWDEPNVLAHTRLNERTDSAGKPGLFIEEIQSDWHQKGRKEGYKQTEKVNPIVEMQPGEAGYADGYRWKFLDNKVGDYLYYKDHMEARRYRTMWAEDNISPSGVPDAPFKTTWHELVFRRLVRMAAEQGKEWLGWTTGEQQAERYDLSKQLDSVQAYKDHDGEVTLFAFNKEGREIFRKNKLTAESAAEYVGKDLAKKIAAQKYPEERRVVYSGLDLTVGGEGMKGFYDKMLVDYANKFGKKFGAKIEERMVPGEHDASGNQAFTERARAVQILDGGGEIYARFKDTPNQEELVKDYNHLIELEQEHGGSFAREYYLGDKQPANVIHSLPITPEMKKSVMAEGVAQFQGAPEFLDAIRNPDPEKWTEWLKSQGQGLTMIARTAGRSIATPEQLDELRHEAGVQTKLGEAAMKAGQWDVALSFASKHQALEEAYEVATGKMFDGRDKLGAVKEQFGADYVPPMAGVQMQPPKTFIVRHGSTEMNAEDTSKDKIRGFLNVPLSDKGRREAQDTAEELKDSGITKIITSDLDRARETADVIAKTTGAVVEEDPGLRPWHFGPTIEGKVTKDMLPAIKDLVEHPDKVPKGGESFNTFRDRFLAAFHAAQDNNPDDTTALVTHYRGVKLLEAWRATGVDNDRISREVFEQFDKDNKPASYDVIDKAGADISGHAEEPAIERMEAQYQPARKPVEEPEKTLKTYKMFRTLKNRPGELFPLFIGAKDPTPIGEWIPARFIPTPGFSPRPGWHVGRMPQASHLMSKEGEMQPGRVWAEVEIPADRNWQPEADKQPTKDIRNKVPADGFYRFKRPASQGGEWLIAGAIKVNRVLSPDEVAQINEARQVPKIQEGGKESTVQFQGTKVDKAQDKKNERAYLSNRQQTHGWWLSPAGALLPLVTGEHQTDAFKHLGETPSKAARNDAYHEESQDAYRRLASRGWRAIVPQVVWKGGQDFSRLLIRGADEKSPDPLNPTQRAALERLAIKHDVTLINNLGDEIYAPPAAPPGGAQFQAPFSHEGFEDELKKIRSGAEGGQTFNPDGTVWQPADKKVDLVSLASTNIPLGDLTQARVQDALKKFADLLEEPGVVAGLYAFSKDGKPTVSVDLNAAVPQKYRENTLDFAKKNDQVAVWDVEHNKEIPAGGKGNTKLQSPGEIIDALNFLHKGKPVDVEDIIKENRETGAAAEEPGLPGMGVGRRPLAGSQLSNMTKADIAAHYPESVVPKTRNEPIPSDIVNSPLAKAAGGGEAAEKAFGRKLVEFAREWQDKPGFQSGLKWYSEFVPMLKEKFGAHAPLMAELLAGTSPNEAPENNYAMAVDALEGFKAGRFNKSIAKFEEGLDKLKDGSWKKWLDREIKSGKVADAPETPSAETFVNHWVAKHDLKPRKTNGKLYGISSDAVLKILARKWLGETAGLKTQNFVKNLLGTGHDATVDLWADRTMRRIGYSGSKARWRILPKNSTGVSDADFLFSQAAFRHAAKELGMKPDELQGALWFAEKQLWADNGWGRLDLGDYRKEIAKTEMLKQGIKRISATQKAVRKATQAEQPELLVTPREIRGAQSQPPREGESDFDYLDWSDFGNKLVHPDNRIPANEGKPPDVTLEDLKAAGFKSLDIKSNGSHHDYTTRPVPVRDDSGEFPLTEAGFKRAEAKARREEIKMHRLYAESQEQL